MESLLLLLQEPEEWSSCSIRWMTNKAVSVPIACQWSCSAIHQRLELQSACQSSPWDVNSLVLKMRFRWRLDMSATVDFSLISQNFSLNVQKELLNVRSDLQDGGFWNSYDWYSKESLNFHDSLQFYAYSGIPSFLYPAEISALVIAAIVVAWWCDAWRIRDLCYWKPELQPFLFSILTCIPSKLHPSVSFPLSLLLFNQVIVQHHPTVRKVYI